MADEDVAITACIVACIVTDGHIVVEVLAIVQGVSADGDVAATAGVQTHGSGTEGRVASARDVLVQGIGAYGYVVGAAFVLLSGVVAEGNVEVARGVVFHGGPAHRQACSRSDIGLAGQVADEDVLVVGLVVVQASLVAHEDRIAIVGGVDAAFLEADELRTFQVKADDVLIGAFFYMDAGVAIGVDDVVTAGGGGQGN